MGKVKVVIIEDEFVIAEDIQTHLHLSGYEVSGIFDHAEKALTFVLQNRPDLLLVDIKLAGPMNGIALVKEVKASLSIPVVYITANSDQATYEQAKSTRPHAFLIKPFSSANLLASVDLALYHFSNETTPDHIERPVAKEYETAPFEVNGSLFIRTNGKYKKIHCEDMLYIEADGSYVHIQTKQERFTLSQNLSHFHKKTPLPNLARIHRSYIVNMNHVDSFEDSFVYIKDQKFPISENFREEFLTRIRRL
jgi:DNA-binding LytR/AlgR family response regulator